MTKVTHAVRISSSSLAIAVLMVVFAPFMPVDPANALVTGDIAQPAGKAAPSMGAVAGKPLIVDNTSHVVVMEYEAWFGPKANHFSSPSVSPVPLLQSADMAKVGGGYDSADPAIIRQHVKWMEHMGIDAAILNLTNNVSCIFDSGSYGLDPTLLNPCMQKSIKDNQVFQAHNQQIAANTANIYTAWSQLGTSLKIIPMLSCQDSGCLVPYKEDRGFGYDPCTGSGNFNANGPSSIEREMAFFTNLMAAHPNMNVIYQGKPLVLIFVGSPQHHDLCRMDFLSALLAKKYDSQYTIRMVSGNMDIDRAFWADKPGIPSGPVALGPTFARTWWSWVDRLKPSFNYYPSYNKVNGRVENFTASIATAGQNKWGSRPAACQPAPAKDPSLKTCQPGTDYYVDTSLRNQDKVPYSTFSSFMSYADRLKPVFLILHQFNGFTPAGEGWDANTTDDIEPAGDNIGFGGIDAVSQQVQSIAMQPVQPAGNKDKAMYRFYCQDADFSKSSIDITDTHEIHHIKNVLRLKKGSLVQIFNARSQQADAVIEGINESAIHARVKMVKHNEEVQVKIILACAPPKKGKFELIIEKCTELGVDEIIPLKTKRTEVIFKEDRVLAKLSRFESVAVNAAKQSKRTKVPRVCPMMSLPQVLQSLGPNGVHLLPSLHGHPKHIADVLLKSGQQKPVTIFIGPEGDFTPDEVEMAIKHGCVPVSLGDTVLKVETAAIATVALVKFLCRN